MCHVVEAGGGVVSWSTFIPFLSSWLIGGSATRLLMTDSHSRLKIILPGRSCVSTSPVETNASPCRYTWMHPEPTMNRHHFMRKRKEKTQKQIIIIFALFITQDVLIRQTYSAARCTMNDGNANTIQGMY
jgi:hypothetical protein